MSKTSPGSSARFHRFGDTHQADFKDMSLTDLERAIDPFASNTMEIRAALEYLLDEQRGRNIELGDPSTWRERLCRHGAAVTQAMLFEWFPLDIESLQLLAEESEWEITRDKATHAYIFHPDADDDVRTRLYDKAPLHVRDEVHAHAGVAASGDAISRENAPDYTNSSAVRFVIRTAPITDHPGTMTATRLLMFARYGDETVSAEAARRLIDHDEQWTAELWESGTAGARKAAVYEIAARYHLADDRQEFYERVPLPAPARRRIVVGVFSIYGLGMALGGGMRVSQSASSYNESDDYTLPSSGGMSMSDDEASLVAGGRGLLSDAVDRHLGDYARIDNGALGVLDAYAGSPAGAPSTPSGDPWAAARPAVGTPPERPSFPAGAPPGFS